MSTANGHTVLYLLLYKHAELCHSDCNSDTFLTAAFQHLNVGFQNFCSQQNTALWYVGLLGPKCHSLQSAARERGPFCCIAATSAAKSLLGHGSQTSVVYPATGSRPQEWRWAACLNFSNSVTHYTLSYLYPYLIDRVMWRHIIYVHNVIAIL